jgi:molybdopterin molybdotransferase
MRPGKPLMFGRIGRTLVLGLPGNPVSALTCALLFLAPLVRALQGDPAPVPVPITGETATPLPANGPRAHYMRATTRRSDSGILRATPVRSQDSSLLSPLADADVLLVRPIDAPALPAGAAVPLLTLDF